LAVRGLARHSESSKSQRILLIPTGCSFNIAAVEHLETKVLIAVIAASASLATALLSLVGVTISLVYNRNSQREIETLKSKFAERKSIADAKRDYMYSARRRLYSECEPGMFQLVEACAVSKRRIEALFNQDLADMQSEDGRFSALLQLLLPSVLFFGIQDRLTLYDLSIEPRIHLQYELGKLICATWSDDRKLAAVGDPRLSYHPEGAAKDQVSAERSIYTLQGIAAQRLDAFAAALRIATQESPSNLSFRYLIRAKDDRLDPLKEAVRDLEFLLRGFTIAEKPVLSRVLAAQSILCDLICKTPAFESVDWKRAFALDSVQAQGEGDQLLIDAFEAARLFLQPKLELMHEKFNLRAGGAL